MSAKTSESWHRKRLDGIFSRLKGADALLIANASSEDPNFLYLTGFKSGLFEDSFIVATPKRMHLITTALEYGTAMDQAWPGLQISAVSSWKEIWHLLHRLLKGKRVGINMSFVPASFYIRLKKEAGARLLVDASAAFSQARQVKGKEEIRAMKKAVSITKQTMVLLPRYFRAGMTELQLAARFDFLQMGLGASSTSFNTIVCFGSNAAEPHHASGNRKLRKGDIVLIDAGGKFSNYCSDITRTFVFGKKANPRQARMIGTVAKAQKLAIGMIRRGVNGKNVHFAAKAFIDSAERGIYKDRFIHSLGHSIGIDVHDGLGLGPQDNILKAGMVVSVEPGIYVPGFGGARIEDDVLVTENGCEVL